MDAEPHPSAAKREADEDFHPERFAAWQQLLAEFIGTAFLLMAMVGAGIQASAGSATVSDLGLLGISLATGLSLFVLIPTFGHVSGAHFNPVVSLVMALRRDITPIMAALYTVAQCAGGFVGLWIAHAMFKADIFQIATSARSGFGMWLAEFMCTAGLLLVILNTSRAAPHATPAAVGLFIFAAFWFTASTAFANPAATLARTFTNTLSGIRPADMGQFIASQYLGALFAWALNTFALQPQDDATPTPFSANKPLLG